MASSRWKKQNSFIRNTGFAISLVISGLLVILLLSLGIEQGGIVSLIVAVLGFIVTLTLSNRKPKTMTRILLFDYKEIERDFRILFKDNFIRYIRRTEDDAYRYEFPGHNLSMTIQPYTIDYYSHFIDRQLTRQPTTEVTLGELNKKNEAFAEKLAESIDEMANKLANNQNKT